MTVIERDKGWYIVDKNDCNISGPFQTNAQAWSWIDKNDCVELEMQATKDRVRDAFYER